MSDRSQDKQPLDKQSQSQEEELTVENLSITDNLQTLSNDNVIRDVAEPQAPNTTSESIYLGTTGNEPVNHGTISSSNPGESTPTTSHEPQEPYNPLADFLPKTRRRLQWIRRRAELSREVTASLTTCDELEAKLQDFESHIRQFGGVFDPELRDACQNLADRVKEMQEEYERLSGEVDSM